MLFSFIYLLNNNMREGREWTLDMQRTQLTEIKNNMAFHSQILQMAKDA